MPKSNYPGGFAYGVTIRNVPIVNSYAGNIYWVDGTNGAAANPGTFNQPVSTLSAAVGKCTANQGDIIMVKPGHAEFVSAATTLLSTAGIAIVGLGVGSNRPTLTLDTAATANLPITAANISIKNFLFKFNFSDIASVFTATGTSTPTDFCLDTCEFRDTSSILNALTIVTGNATAHSMDGLTVMNCTISSLGTTAATTAIKLLSVTDRVNLLDNYGNWAILNDTAALLDASTFNVTNFNMGRNVLYRPNTSSTGGSFVSGSGTAWTGHAYDNYMYQLDATAGIWIPTGTGIGFSQNFSPITGAADKSGLTNPAAV
jgi:hypothetical protein